MKSKILLGCLLTVLLAACSKDKYTTRPQLTFKSVNLTTVGDGDVITFKLEYTDKEGDISGHLLDPANPSFLDSLLVIEKVARNCEDSYLVLYYAMPEVPVIKDTKGELQVTYGVDRQDYPNLPPAACPGKNDSCVFRFVLKDHARNISDTVSSPEIVILQ